MSYEELFNEAIMTIETAVEHKQTFEVKELFGVRWNTLKKGEKTGFGSYFSRQYSDGRLPMIERVGETKSHHNKYRKL